MHTRLDTRKLTFRFGYDTGAALSLVLSSSALRTSQHPSTLTPSPAHLTLSFRPSQSAPSLTIKISTHSLNSLSRSARRTTSHSFSPAQPTAPLTLLIPSSSVPLAFSLAHTLALSDLLSLPSSLGLSHRCLLTWKTKSLAIGSLLFVGPAGVFYLLI
ncbi:hypothetical protein TorRG33x02_351260 [Trema orientale]|uniref:Uncharacterized protein n=1 Tax=Trema orientale TaxID=63057 RepID=A0A2P5AG09_TREOI|nr:hypothetical protein TorRG33x02_351260 [Trema orientale]